MTVLIALRASCLVLALATAVRTEAQTPVDPAASAQPQPDTTSGERTSKSVPFAFGDFTWVNGNGRAHYSPLATKYFTPEFRLDANYISDFNQPKDHAIDGSSETGRTNEVQVQPGFVPNLVRDESRLSFAVLVEL